MSRMTVQYRFKDNTEHRLENVIQVYQGEFVTIICREIDDVQFRNSDIQYLRVFPSEV